MKSIRPQKPAAPKQSALQRARAWAAKPVSCTACRAVRAVAGKIVGKAQR